MTPATALPPAAQRTCPQCQSPLGEEQEWCLNCGAGVGARVARSPNWKLPLAIIGVIVVLCGAALAFALVQVFGGDDSTSLVSNPTPTTPTPTAPANVPAGPTSPPADIGPTGASGPTGPANTTGPGGPTGPAVPPVDVPPANTDPPPDDTAPAGGTVASWPDGEEAFTVVLESTPSRSGAQRVAQRLADGGTDVGVLNSSDFSSLNGGYWVVYSGQFDTEDQAAEEADALRDTAPGAYPRLVRP